MQAQFAERRLSEVGEMVFVVLSFSASSEAAASAASPQGAVERHLSTEEFFEDAVRAVHDHLLLG
jgi:hypothetical protein